VSFGVYSDSSQVQNCITTAIIDFKIICMIVVRRRVSHGWKGTYRKLKLYRALTCLENIVNDVNKYTTIPSIVCSPWILQILCLYGTFKTGHMITHTPAMFLFFMTAYINMAVGSIVVDTVASRVFTDSKTLLGLWRKTVPSWSKYSMKQLTALVPARIRFGDNFINQSTAIVVQNFVISQTVSLIIIE